MQKKCRLRPPSDFEGLLMGEKCRIALLLFVTKHTEHEHEPAASEDAVGKNPDRSTKLRASKQKNNVLLIDEHFMIERSHHNGAKEAR
jgi:hypothetical protein